MTPLLEPIHIKKDGRAGRRIKKVYSKICRNCRTSFIGIAIQSFCSDSCKGEFKYTSRVVTTESQYRSISGNWKKYFQRILNKSNRVSLSLDDCLDLLHRQNYRCALSDTTLTCLLEKGKKFKTNASIDRIEAGGPYVKENIQLVCAALNSWRSDTDLTEFIWWCKKVTECQEKEVSPHA